MSERPSLDRTAADQPDYDSQRSPSRPDDGPRAIILAHARPISTAAPARSALVLAFAAIYLIWGSTYLGIRIAIETMPPFLMAGARFLIAGSIIFALIRIRGGAWPTAHQWIANSVIGTFLLLGGNGLVVWAELTIPSGVTALLIGIGPLFIVLTEWAWPGGTRPTVITIGALLLGFAGVTWLAAPWETSSGGRLSPEGVVSVLGACVFWAIGSIYSRHAKHGADPFLASSLQMLGGGGALMIVAFAHGDFARFDLAAVTPRAWVAFAYLISIGSLVGFSTFVWLMKHSTPARVATYAYVNPIVAVFLGWLVLGEPVTTRTLIASAIIIAAVVVITTVEKPERQDKSRLTTSAPVHMRIALAQTDDEIARCFLVMTQLRPGLIEKEFVPRIRRMQNEGFHLAFLDDAGAIRAVAGYRYHDKLHSGRNLYVDDLVTDAEDRSRGYGGKLLAWLTDEARSHGCVQLELDSGVQRFDAHRFYFRERMHVSAYHFIVPVKM